MKSFITAVKEGWAVFKENYSQAREQSKSRALLKNGWHYNLRPRVNPITVGQMGAFIHIDNVLTSAMGAATVPYAVGYKLLTQDGTVVPHLCDVVMNDKLAAAPKHILDAIIAHECGHCHHQHDVSRDGRQLQYECEADLYAQDNGYDMIAALEWFIAYPSTLIDKDELRARITALEAHKAG